MPKDGYNGELAEKTEGLNSEKARTRESERERRERTLTIEEMDGFCDLEECSEQCMITEQLFMLG